MTSKSIARTAVIAISALLIGGCQFKNNSGIKASPTPKPTPIATQKPTPTPSATPVASPSATKVVTKSGRVKGASTTSPISPNSLNSPIPQVSLYDTSFDTLQVTNFPGQELEKELVLYNKSDKPAMYAVRASDKPSDMVPVTINGSFEATGNMLPLSQETVKIRVKSNNQNPNFAYNVTVNFMSNAGQMLATRVVRITAYTPIGDRVTVETDTPTDKSTNRSMDVAYKANASYPIRVVNKNQRNLNFTTKILTNEAAGKMAISVAQGYFKSGDWWDTDVHFTDKALNGLTKVDIAFTFTDAGNDTYTDTKILTVNIK